MNNIDMRQGSLLKQIILFSIPVILSGFIQNLFNAADMIVVGNFAGSNALAAVGATSSLCNAMVNFFLGLSVGCGVVSSHFFGANDDENLGKVINTAFYSSILVGFLLILIGFVFSKPLLKIMGTPDNILNSSTLYIKIYFLGMPANMVFNFLNAISRSIGDTKRPMIYLLLSGIVNILLNLLFVIIFKLSVVGVALATIISQYISAALITLRFIRSEYPLKLYKGFEKFNIQILKKIFNMGLPAGIQSTAISISNVYIQSAVNYFGSSSVAGYTAAANIGGFLYLALNSIYQTSMTLTAQNFGCGNFKRIKKGIILSEAVVAILGVTICMCAFIFRDPLLRLYTNDPVSLEAGYKYYSIIASTYFLCGMMEVMTGGLRGLGKSLEAMIITMSTMALFRIIWNYTAFAWVKTLETVYIAYPISWTMSIIIMIFRLKHCIKKCELQYSQAYSLRS